MTASIGISLARPNVANFPVTEPLSKQARIASLDARAVGGNCKRVYSPEMDAQLFRQNRIGQALHEAISQNQFSLSFQPQFALDPPVAGRAPNPHLIGVEALLRWDSPALGSISPKEFMSIAEKTGMANEVDLHVMALFSAQLGNWGSDAGGGWILR